VLVLVAALLALTGSLLASPATAATPSTAVPGTVVLNGHTYWTTSNAGVYQACPPPTPGHGSCQATVRSVHDFASAPALSPSDLQNLYDTAAGTSGGYGQTVGIVDAYDDPNAEADMTAFRNYYGIAPACTSANGCFRKLSEYGSTTSLPPAAASEPGNWDLEISLDLDMVSAICPNCSIRLIEAASTSVGDFGQAENEAVVQGARFVSNSWRGPEYGSGEVNDQNSYYNHPGVVTTASSGDYGYAQGASWPAVSQYVTAVGGTVVAGSKNYWTQQAWSLNSTGYSAGSGCSAYIPRPVWQTLIYTGCSSTSRAESDVSAIAGGNGVTFWDTYNGHGGLGSIGGTSAASPIVASLYALNGTPTADNPEFYPFRHGSAVTDINDGTNNGGCGTPTCVSGFGWDGPTGLGTPNNPNELGDNGVLMYNPLNGYGYAVHRSALGPVTDIINTFSTGWTNINQFGDGHLLFYRAGTGAYATGHKIGSGQVLSDYSSSGLSTNWSNFAPFGDGELLFYALGASAYSLAHHLSNGQLQTDYIGSGLSTNWSSIIPLGDNVHLVFWQAASGAYSIAHHTASGQLVTDYIGSGLSGYNRITPFGDGTYLLATTPTGGWAVLWHSSVNGSLTPLTTGSGAGTNWTSITPFGDGSLLFYNSVNGAANIGYRQSNNTFAFYFGSISMPAGNSVVATTY
jgi:subtilase family serine protease